MAQKPSECQQCGAENWGTFVQYGSYFLTCLSCKAAGPVTSYLAIGRQLEGPFRAVEVDDNFVEIRVIAEGNGVDLFDVVSREAGKGKLIFLEPTRNPCE